VSIRGELIGIQRQLGVTTLYVTHDQEEALAMSDWVAVMNHGRVVQWGTPWEVYYRPRTPFMADFLGSVNLVPSRVLRTGPGLAVVELGGQGVPVAHEDAAGLTAEQAVLLSIRPESLALANAEWRMPNDGPPVEGGLALPGRVVGRTFLGHLMRYVVQAGSGVEWLVDQPDPDGAALFEGEVVIVVNPRRIHLISERDG
jgi:ABC-type Fe3+/spermidine/putrescine transport system ATPase subunit